MTTDTQADSRNVGLSAGLDARLDELLWLADGRKVDVHFGGADAPEWARASVYVRGDARDNYNTCVASGSGATMPEALAQASANMAARKGVVSDAYLMLGRRGLNEVLIESGSRLNGSLLRAGVVDELLVYVAPRLIGEHGRGMFDLPELAALESARRLEFRDVTRCGADLRIVARPA